MWRIRILPTQTVRFNVKIKHNIRERPLASSHHSTIPFKGIKVDYVVFSQFHIFLSYAFPMESLFAHWEKPRWFSPYLLPSQTGPFSLSNLQNYNSNGRKIDSENSLDVIVMSFKTHFQKTVAIDKEPYGGVMRTERAARCRRRGEFTSSGLQRDAGWFCTKMQETDYVADLHVAQWDALGEAQEDAWSSRESCTCNSPSCKHWKHVNHEGMGDSQCSLS